MKLEFDVIIVLLIFVGFCIGSMILVKQANKEMNNNGSENIKKDNNIRNKR